MANRDIFSDLACLLCPVPEYPGDEAPNDQLEAWQAVRDEAERDREDVARDLRLRWENADDYDPLLSEIRTARSAMLAAEQQMRLLIAYGRELVEPRPYKLDDLARASGMSISGVRTAYDDDEVAEASRLTGARPRRRAETPA